MSKPNPNYFAVNRLLLFSGLWLSEPFTRGQAWVDLFGLAQHDESFVRIRGIKIDLKRGQMAYSQLTLALRWKWSRNKVRRYLNELEKEGNIEQQNNEVTTLITIKKYNQWQGDGTTNDTTEDQQKNNGKTTEGTHTKKGNNEKNDNNNTAKAVLTEVTKKKEFGNQEINEMLLALKNKIGISAFADGTKWERIYGQNCVRLIRKIGKEDFVRRLDTILQDDFKHKNCNRIKFVYCELNGFIEPSATARKGKGVFIS